MNITGTTRMSLGATINGRKASEMTPEEREQFAQSWVARHGGSFEWTEEAESSIEPEKPTTDTDKKARATFDALLRKPWPDAMREIYAAVQKAEKYDRLVARHPELAEEGERYE